MQSADISKFEIQYTDDNLNVFHGIHNRTFKLISTFDESFESMNFLSLGLLVGSSGEV